jgi:hypothetical protein
MLVGVELGVDVDVDVDVDDLAKGAFCVLEAVFEQQVLVHGGVKAETAVAVVKMATPL